MAKPSPKSVMANAPQHVKDFFGDTPFYQHQNKDGTPGAWVKQGVEIGPNVTTGSEALIMGGKLLGGTIRGGTIYGGEIYGGEILGGEIYGGEIRGGLIYGGEIHSGIIRGGTIYGGIIRGGIILGGTIFGGEIRGGIYVQNMRVSITPTVYMQANNVITICDNHVYTQETKTLLSHLQVLEGEDDFLKTLLKQHMAQFSL